MEKFKYVTNNEIAFDSSEDAFKTAELLLKNGYIVMISKEEHLTIVNYSWTCDSEANRNEVCFQTKEAVEEFAFSIDEE